MNRPRKPIDEGVDYEDEEEHDGKQDSGRDAIDHAAVHEAADAEDLVAQDRTSLLVGATATGELTLGRYGGSPDATLAALLLIEMSARFGGKLRALMDEAKGKP